MSGAKKVSRTPPTKEDQVKDEAVCLRVAGVKHHIQALGIKLGPQTTKNKYEKERKLYLNTWWWYSHTAFPSEHPLVPEQHTLGSGACRQNPSNTQAEHDHGKTWFLENLVTELNVLPIKIFLRIGRYWNQYSQCWSMLKSVFTVLVNTEISMISNDNVDGDENSHRNSYKSTRFS